MDIIPNKVLSILAVYFLISVTRFCNGFQSMKIPHSLPHHDSRTGSTNCMGLQTQATTRNFLSSQNDPVGESNEVKGDDDDDDGRIDVSVDERLYRVRISRAPGIEWGTDLSFSFVYVRDMDPTGEASLLGMISKDDQLCELIPVTTKPKDDAANAKPINLLGASFDFVMTSFASLDRTVSEMDLVFFRGNKQELKALCNGEAVKSEIETVTITVIQNKGSPQEELKRLQAPVGVNVRQYLVDNGINVYQSLTRWTNCKGKQLCGTCIVNVADGIPNTNWKSMDEASTLRSNPDSYRLSCVTFAHGDITVETFPPVNADQWTR
ncbi:MAG: ferredoxin [Bacillariaceae sp.]|jgi:ferredoxin